MGDEKHDDNRSVFDKLMAVLLRQSWLEVLGDVGMVVRKVVQGGSYRGMYEVLGYEATLELEDPEGKRWGLTHWHQHVNVPRRGDAFTLSVTFVQPVVEPSYWRKNATFEQRQDQLYGYRTTNHQLGACKRTPFCEP